MLILACEKRLPYGTEAHMHTEKTFHLSLESSWFQLSYNTGELLQVQLQFVFNEELHSSSEPFKSKFYAGLTWALVVFNFQCDSLIAAL